MVGACLEGKVASPVCALNKIQITEQIEVAHKTNYKLGILLISIFVALSCMQNQPNSLGESICEKHNAALACQVW